MKEELKRAEEVTQEPEANQVRFLVPSTTPWNWSSSAMSLSRALTEVPPADTHVTDGTCVKAPAL